MSADTVRDYERAGLLPAAPRTASGYRAFDLTAVDRLKLIQRAQRLGLQLKDIADLIAVRDTGECPCEPAEQLLRRRLADLDAQMAQMAALRADGGDDRRNPVGAVPAAGTGDMVRPEHREEVTAMTVWELSCCDDPDCPPDCDSDCC